MCMGITLPKLSQQLTRTTPDSTIHARGAHAAVRARTVRACGRAHNGGTNARPRPLRMRARQQALMQTVQNTTRHTQP